jgi:hypothetical protein
VQAICAVPTPKNITEVRSFVSFVGYYRKFIKKIAHLAAPLYLLTHLDSDFKWTAECTAAFQALKDALTSAEVLAAPDFSQPLILQCDASNIAIGSVLSQIQFAVERPIAYASRQLSKSEKNYTVTEKELLAIVWSVRHFDHYLFGRQVTIVTDHKPLADLNKLKKPLGQLGKLLLKIQHLDYKIQYKPGRLNTNADFLSRAVVNSLVLTDSMDWLSEQSKDPLLQTLKGFLNTEVATKVPAELKLFEMRLAQIQLNSMGVLVLIPSQDGQVDRIVVPSHMYEQICTEYHAEASIGAHLGITKTQNRIAARFFWPFMRLYLKSFIARCHVCQTQKMPVPISVSPLQPIVARAPWELVHIDVTGPLTRTASNNRYIIVIIDHFSKWCECVATPNFTALTTAKCLMDRVVCRFGAPLVKW